MADLPETGARARLEGLDDFERGGKRIQSVYDDMVASEMRLISTSAATGDALANAASASTAAAEASAEAWREMAAAVASSQGGKGPSAEATSAAAEAWDELAAGMAEANVVALETAEVQEAASSAVEETAKSADVAAQAWDRIKVAEEALLRIDPKVAKGLKNFRDLFIAGGGAAEDYANIVEEALRGVQVEASEAGDALEDMGEKTTGSLESLAQLVGLGALGRVASEAGRVGDRLLDMAKQATMAAARVEELDAVLVNMSTNSEYSEAQLRAEVEAVKSMGVTSDVASTLVSQFVRSNLDLSQASALARLAQDAAVISMEDSSQALSGMLHGILTLQPELLRYRGIIVDFQSEYKKWADANDRTTLSLTGTEKQAIALNAVLAQGDDIAGTYEAAMDTAGKQIRSFRRYIQELQEDFGSALLPAFTDLVFLAKDTVNVFRNLSQPVKEAIAVTGALTGAMLKGGATAVQYASYIAQTAVALKTLAAAQQFAALGMLGPAGLIAGIVALVGIGVATWVRGVTREQEAQARSAFDTAESYREYLARIEDAKAGNLQLSESAYEVVKAYEKTGQAIDAVDFVKTQEQVMRMVKHNILNAQQLAAVAAAAGDTASEAEILEKQMLALVWAADALQLATLQDAEALFELFISQEINTAQAGDLAERIAELAKKLQYMNQNMELEDPWSEMPEKVDEYTESIDKNFTGLKAYRQALAELIEYEKQVPKLTAAFEDLLSEMQGGIPIVQRFQQAFDKIIQTEGESAAMVASVQAINQAIQEGAEDTIETEERAAKDRLSAVADFTQDAEDLERDRAKAVGSILDDMADATRDYHNDVIEAERDAAAEREKIVADMARDIAQAEADLAADREEAARELAEDLADIEREYAEKRAEAARDLERDLADIARELQQDRVDAYADLVRDIQKMGRDYLRKMEEMERDHYASLKELAEDYGATVASITEKYAQERQSIMEKYNLDPELDFDERRQALMEELRDLEALEASDTGAKSYRSQIEAIKEELENLKAEELAALEERKQAELDELEKWLAAEQEARELAYAEAQAAEGEAFQEKAEERAIAYLQELQDLQEAARREIEEKQRAYREELEDLERAKQNEIDARNRAYVQELEDLKAKHEKERAEIERRAAEALLQVDDRLAEEKIRLDAAYLENQQRLKDQLKDEKTNYDDRLAALETAYTDRMTVIDTEEEAQKEAILFKTQETISAIIAAWEALGGPVAEALRRMLEDGIKPILDEARQAVQDWKAGVEHDLESSPVSGWALGVGKAITRGFKEGIDIEGALSDITSDLGDWKTEVETILDSSPVSGWALEEGRAITRGLEKGLNIGDVLSGAMADLKAWQGQMVAAPSLPVARGPRGEYGKVENTKNYNLSYTGRPLEETSLRGQFALMEASALG